MKIKDIPKNQSLKNIKIKVPDNVECEIREGYWYSQWGHKDGKAGVWLKTAIDADRIYPAFLDNLEEMLEWEVLD